MKIININIFTPITFLTFNARGAIENPENPKDKLAYEIIEALKNPEKFITNFFIKKNFYDQHDGNITEDFMKNLVDDNFSPTQKKLPSKQNFLNIALLAASTMIITYYILYKFFNKKQNNLKKNIPQ